MNARLVVVLIGEIALALLARSDWSDLRRLGARRAAYVITIATIGLVALSAVAYNVSIEYPWWLAVVLFVPVVFASLYPAQIVRLTGGPLLIVRLWAALQEMNDRSDQMTSVNEITAEDEAWMVDQSKRLDLLRSPETAELVDLWQAKIADRLRASDSPESDAELARNDRIREAQDRLAKELPAVAWRR